MSRRSDLAGRLGKPGPTRAFGGLAFAVMAVLFAAILLRAEAARSSGTEIILETRPIDPRDAFFGHYAVLRYAIDGMDVAPLADPALRERLQEDQDDLPETVWLALAPEGAFHRPVLASADREAAAAAGLALPVSVRRRWFVACEPGDEACAPTLVVKADLPDRYYADPETAVALEELMRERNRRAAEISRFDECAAYAAKEQGQTDGPIPFCEDLPEEAPAPLTEEDRFGVILSVAEDGSAVIKGLRFGGRSIYDRLGQTLVLDAP